MLAGDTGKHHSVSSKYHHQNSYDMTRKWIDSPTHV